MPAPRAASLPLAVPGAAVGALGLLAAAAVAGVALITLSYSWAASHDSGTTHFAIFWAGALLIAVPASIRLASAEPRRFERLGIVTGAALAFAVPKLLRSPGGPIFADEIAHWRQSELLARTGELYLLNPFLSVVDRFPGMHTLTIALRDAAGLSTWQAAVVLVFLWTALSALGVYMIAEELLGSSRAAGLAALVYVLNPSFMFFDTQYAYESMALPLLVWALVVFARLQRPNLYHSTRVGLVLLGGLLGAALAVTHHLTTIILLGLCVVFAVTAVAHRGARDRRPAMLATLALVGVLGAEMGVWLAAAPEVSEYLAPHLSGGLADLQGLLEREGDGGRQLFGASTAPAYERLIAYGAPVVAGLLTLAGLWYVRRRGVRAALVALLAFGLVYFPSVPFILTEAGAEGARRSWAYTYVGVALFAGIGLIGLLRSRRARVARATQWAAVPAAVAVLLVGNVASGMSVEYRFPGPFVFGSDSRSLTPELRASTDWFTATQGTGRRMVADRASGLSFALLGLNWTERAWSGLPLWDFYLRAERPERRTLEALESLGTRYLVVDKRTPRSLPRTGVYMVGDEPGANAHVTPPPAAAIEKYARTPWLIRVYESDSYVVYRFAFGALDVCTDQRPEPGATARGCPA
jgi:hypothetical protein